MDIRAYVKKLELMGTLRIASVTEEMWLRNIELEWDHKDPADRTIVASAMLYDIPLLTQDEKIRQFYSKAVW